MKSSESRKLARAYKLTAFGSGFALLAYELAGARMLTPAVGSSTYVWTSIIGVIVAALSAGYVLGGQLADKRNRPSDIVLLLLLSAAAVSSTLLLIDFTTELLLRSRLDIRLEAVLASVLLFAPGSVLLGSLSPYLAKLHTTSLTTAGSSIASLSALNSLGSILGTFLTGFVFFGYVGSRAVLGAVIVLLALLSIAVAISGSKLRVEKLSLLLVAIGVLLSVGHNGSVVVAFDTPHANYQIRDITRDGRRVRVLTMGPGGYQSGVYLDNPDELVFDYTHAMAKTIASSGAPQRMLVLGGGTYTLPEYLANRYPSASVDVVELDQKLTTVAEQYFGFEQPQNLHIINQDARVFVDQSISGQYDVIMLDVFSDNGIPFSVVTTEFVSRINAHLSARGYVLANVIAGTNPDCNPLLQSISYSFSSHFKYIGLSPVQASTLMPRQNILLSASQTNHAFMNNSMKPTESAATKLTDDFAPIERLHQDCFRP